MILASDIAGRGYPWPAALAWLPVLLFNIAGYLILIPIYGAKGAAISSTASFVILFSFILIYYRHTSGLPLSEILFLKRGDMVAIMGAMKGIFISRSYHDKARTYAAEALPDKSQAENERVGASP